MKGQPRRLGADATSQLVLGGYGPAGVIFLALALLVVLVPSKAPESRQTIATTRPAQPDAMGTKRLPAKKAR